MAKYILRRDNGLISKGERCIDEPRFVYLRDLGKSVDFTTTDKKQAKVFDEKDIPEEGLTVHSKEWKFIKI
jgi:hypothetical protein